MRRSTAAITALLTACTLFPAGTAFAGDGSTDPNARPETPRPASITMGTASVPTAPQPTNLGPVRPVIFTGHDLTPPTALLGGGAILYAPSEADDPTFRAELSAATGQTVDYLDARAETPSAALLSGYAAVFTWANFAYQDRDLFGDRLADYVDGGGVVVLGAFCTYDTLNSLGGQIRTPGYSPVDSPTGDNFLVLSEYAGDGVSCYYDGVDALGCVNRDILVLQGGGILDGTFEDGSICFAYRPDGRVMYANGAADTTVGCDGDSVTAVANAVSGCLLGSISCACDGQFAIGDRVVSLVDAPGGNEGITQGLGGTVVCGFSSAFILVMWDGLETGHDGNGNCACPSNGEGGGGGEITLPGGTGWFVACETIALACEGDLSGDGLVGFDDLLVILNLWGNCP